MYYTNKFVWVLLNPATVGLLAAVVCWTLSRRRLFRLLAFPAIAWLWLWCTPFMTGIVGSSLERGYVLLKDDGSSRMREAAEYPICDAIVDLGGGTGTMTNFSSSVMLNSSADRVYFSAQLWKAGKAPIVISSGAGCSQSDGRFLLDLGVSPSAIVAEDCARNTEENAKYVGQMMRQKHGRRILLVTSAWHMKRSLLMFEKYAEGLEVIPAPCDFECCNGGGGFDMTMLLPTFDVAGRNAVYFHEWLGIWGYRMFR